MSNEDKAEDNFHEASDLEILRVNVRGRKFELLKREVGAQDGENRLAQFLSLSATHTDRMKMAKAHIPAINTYFINSSAVLFQAFLDFTLHPESGLHVPGEICVDQFIEELKFWNINPLHVAPCCNRRLELDNLDLTALSYAYAALESVDDPCPKVPNHDNSQPTPATPLTSTDEENKPDPYEKVCLGDNRRRLWITMDDPGSSKPAKVFGGMSIFFICLSVLSLIIASLPECQYDNGEPHWTLEVAEYFCIAWFTLEYLSRFMVTAEKCKYLRSPMEVVDLLSIFPFYLELALTTTGTKYGNLENLRGALLVMRLLRVLRVARIFKLARYSVAMKSCGRTLRESRREVGMLVVFVSIMIVLFSTTVYFMEKDHPGTKFTSVPTSFWWCVVTITTVGYGDMTPETTGGRLMASLASVSGVVVLAFPITVIVENFYRFYRKEKKEADDLEGSRFQRRANMAV